MLPTTGLLSRPTNHGTPTAPNAAKTLLATILLAGTTLLTGCAQTPKLGTWEGPSARVQVKRSPWVFKTQAGRDVPGEILESDNYRLYTTIPNSETRERLVQLLEAAQVEYRKVAPTAGPTRSPTPTADGTSASPGPLECYVFADRPQWLLFTRRTTGADARIYERITRGGFTIRDYFVAYLTDDRDTWSVTAHEGFHQFCARHFAGRLPPFLEEGLACAFEQVRWQTSASGSVPRLNPIVNPSRAQSLRNVLEAKAAWPLKDLCRLHAGQVVGASGIKIEGFYAQSWAFARFVQEYKSGKYQPRFATWVAETVAGTSYDPSGTHQNNRTLWDPNAVPGIIEHYLGTDLATLQGEFDEWCRYVAYEEFSSQWANQ